MLAQDNGEWTTYTTDDGLGNLNTWAVAPSPVGGIWIGTGNKHNQNWPVGGGVSYFDGTSWTTWKTWNCDIVSNDIPAIAVDHNGVAWFGAYYGGLSRFDGNAWTTYNNNSLWASAMTVDHNNTLWFASRWWELVLYDGEEFRPQLDGIFRNSHTLAVDHDNSIWVGGIGGVIHYDGVQAVTYTVEEGLAGDEVFGIAVDHDGTKWFATSMGVSTFDGATWTTQPVLRGKYVLDVAIDHCGVKWFARAGNLTSWDGVEEKTYTTDNSGLLSNHLSKIAVDRNNVKWITARAGGVTSFDDHSGPYLRLTSPLGREIWKAGDTHRITWVSKGVETITIQYSGNDGSYWYTLAENVDAETDSFAWTHSGIDSDKCRVRIMDDGDHSRTDTSKFGFSITMPYITLLSPEHGNDWERNTTYRINWNALDIETVTIEYSSDNKASWHTITDAGSVIQGYHEWTTPDTVSANCYIRITGNENPALTQTVGPFAIVGSEIEVTFPGTGDVIDAYSNPVLTWNASSGVGTMRIEFSSNAGKTWNLVADNLSHTSRSYTWHTANMASEHCLLRITDTTHDNITGINTGFFTIKPPPVWDQGWTTYSVFDGLPTNRLWDVACDNEGGVWIGAHEANSPGAAYYNGDSWTLYDRTDNGLPSKMISAVAVEGDNTAWFGALYGTGRDNAHYGGGVSSFDGETWTHYDEIPGDVRDIVVDRNQITWFATWGHGLWSFDGTTWMNYTGENSGIPFTAIKTIALDVDNTLWIGSGSWSIYVSGYGLAHFDGTEWAHYTTGNAGLISNSVKGIAVDQNGVKWIATYEGVSRFDGETWTNYTEADGLPWHNVEAIAVDHDNIIWAGTRGGLAMFDGTKWTSYTKENSSLLSNEIVGIAVDQENVKWLATWGGGLSSFDYQHIGKRLRLTTPMGGELLLAGSRHNITWESERVEALKIEFSPDSGASWETVTESTDGAGGSFTWVVPAIESISCLVRITDTTAHNKRHTSLVPFTISKPLLLINTPNSGEDWASGSVNTITWLSLGVETLDIYYSTNGGVSWTIIEQGIDASAGSYDWTVPDEMSHTCMVMIADSENPDIMDTSDFVFFTGTKEPGPEDFCLFQNYPNPFNPVTTITFTLPSAGYATLTIYNIAGQKVRELLGDTLPAGRHAVVWDGCDDTGNKVSAGLYLSRLVSGGHAAVGRMMLVK